MTPYPTQSGFNSAAPMIAFCRGRASQLLCAIYVCLIATYSTSIHASTMTVTFQNNENGVATDLHVNVPHGTTITNPPSGNDRVTDGNDRIGADRHNWYGLNVMGNGVGKVTTTFEFDGALSIKNWFWTTGGDAFHDGDMLGDVHDQSDLKLSFAPGAATGDGVLAINVLGQQHLFETTAGVSATDSAMLFAQFLGDIQFGGQSLFFLNFPDATSVEFLELVLTNTPASAEVLHQDSGQGMTLEDLNAVPEPSSLVLLSCGLACLVTRARMRKR
jgi:hypothetical protein